MCVDYTNPFLVAATSIIRDACQINMTAGEPYLKKTQFENDTVVIMVGITGQLRGQALIVLDYEKSLEIASKMMMGASVTELDDLSISAISELSNMIMGNAATIFSTKGIVIDITPPTVCRGRLTILQAYTKNVCIPLSGDNIEIELDIAIKEA